MKRIKNCLLKAFDNVLGIGEPVISNEPFDNLCINHLDKKEVLEETAETMSITFDKDFLSKQNLSKFKDFSDMLKGIERLNIKES